MKHRDNHNNTTTFARPLQRFETSTTSGVRILDSTELMAGQSSLFIRHLGELYRLQTTRQGKLILTK